MREFPPPDIGEKDPYIVGKIPWLQRYFSLLTPGYKKIINFHDYGLPHTTVSSRFDSSVFYVPVIMVNKDLIKIKHISVQNPTGYMVIYCT